MIKSLQRAVIFTFVSVLGACGAGGVSTGVPSAPSSLVLSFSGAPVDLAGLNARFSADIEYGNQARNTFDIFLPDADTPTGLLIYVHGGGFTSGDKSAAYSGTLAEHVQETLAQGVAYASINYRLLDTQDSEGVLKPLGDSRRALQFMRHHAQALNIDPTRIAMYGSSAGAGTSLWLAFHDDMADFSNLDPVLRQSTRIRAVAAIETQASYDISRWETDVFSDFGITIETLQAASPILTQRLLSFYGITDPTQFESEELAAYRADVDLLALMSADDPAMWLNNSQQSAAIPTTTLHLFHHPFHARELREQANIVGLTNVSYIPTIGIEDPSNEGVMSFLLRQIR